MASIKDVYKSKFLRPDDLEGGKVLTIVKAGAEQVKKFNSDEKELKVVVYFSLDSNGTEKQKSLSATQGYAILDLYGDDTDNWIGKRVYATPEKLSNGMMTIKFLRPQAPDDEIPFD